MSQWYVYIIKTQKDRLYTGITTDPDRRFKEHAGLLPNGAKFFRSDKPYSIVYVLSCSDRSEASKKEAYIKKLKRIQKEKLILESNTI